MTYINKPADYSPSSTNPIRYEVWHYGVDVTADIVTAAYYKIEDGFVAFRDDLHKPVVTYNANEVRRVVTMYPTE